MSPLSRCGRAAVVAALALAAVGTPMLTSAAQAGGSDQPGLVGGRVLLANHASYSGFDVGTDASGYTYIGWIGTDGSSDPNAREVHVCTLAPLGSQCLGGIQTIDSLGVSSAEGLRVLGGDGEGALLVWFHDTDLGSISGPEGAEIATSGVGENGVASEPVDVAAAPSFGELYDAEIAPNHALWTVAGGIAGTGPLEVRDALTGTIKLTTPWPVQGALLAFQGATPVIAVQKDGSVTSPVQTAHGVGAGFSGFTPVAKTWTAGANIGLVGTTTGVRLTASVGNADYWPVISKFTGSGFGKPVPTGDTSSCSPTSHDLVSDASGRVADVADECGKLTVYDLPNTVHEALFRFPSGGVDSSGPAQITTTPRGHGVVVWAIESGDDGNALYFNRILLPGLDTSVSRVSGGGRVTVTGPSSCQPASNIAVSVKGSAPAGTTVASASLRFGGSTLPSKVTLDGALLKPGKVYAIEGTVVFRKNGVTSTGTETLKFRSCINP